MNSNIIIAGQEKKCDHEVFDGNRDDPSYAYCDLPYAHAGDHHYVS